MYQLPDHPEIEMAMRTGYPSWQQEDASIVYCCECGRPLDLETDEVYTCRSHEILCLDCLKMLHRWE